MVRWGCRDRGLSDGDRRLVYALDVLGGTRLWQNTAEGGPPRDLARGLGRRLQELVVFLGVHPEGVRREAVVEALWADSPPHRPTNALITTMGRLRTALAQATGQSESDTTGVGDLVRVLPDGRYQLDPDLVEIDYARFQAAMATWLGALTTSDRAAACRAVLDTYRGELGEGIDSEWIMAPRVACRRDAVDATETLAENHIGLGEVVLALSLLETAVGFDQYNEALYRQIMCLQHRLGRPDAAKRTLRLLSSRLADLDVTPEPETLRLVNPPQNDHGTPPRPPRPGSSPRLATQRPGEQPATRPKPRSGRQTRDPGRRVGR